MRSMTAFAETSDQDEVLTWRWEARSVNGRSLDLRLRLPDGCEALEPRVRAAMKGVVTRGNVTIGLRWSRVADTSDARISSDGIAQALDAILSVETAALDRGVTLAPSTPDRVAALAAQWGGGSEAPLISEERVESMGAGISALSASFAEARAQEGTALHAILAAQVDRIAVLVTDAGDTVEARDARSGEVLRQKVLALLDTTEIVDEGRLAQELAVLAVKADVTEELDRLRTHVDAARELLAAKEPVGRKFDFLAQEFNREANTLCSKSGSAELTQIGLDLKVLIDQMREQIQNVE